MNKHSLAVSAIVRPVVILWGVLAAGALAFAESDDGTCSNHTLRGHYGFSIEGQAGGGPIRGVAMTRFDGQGTLSQVDHIVNNGVRPPVEWRPGTGSYTVNPDCTGTAQINNEGAPGPLNLRFVVVRGGKEIRTVVDGPIAASSIGIKIE